MQLCCGVGERPFLLASLACIAPRTGASPYAYGPPDLPDSLSAPARQKLDTGLVWQELKRSHGQYCGIRDIRWWSLCGILPQLNKCSTFTWDRLGKKCYLCE